jgi:hypothetical protein
MRFTAERAVKLLFKLFLEILNEVKVENEANQKNLEKTFLELEEFLKKEHGISVNLISYNVPNGEPPVTSYLFCVVVISLTISSPKDCFSTILSTLVVLIIFPANFPTPPS